MNAAPLANDASAAAIRGQFAAARGQGLRARDAALRIGHSEGAVVAAHAGAHGSPLVAVLLRREWLALLQGLTPCGPLMALTRNETTVHEKTGVYQNLSAEGHVGLAGRFADPAQQAAGFEPAAGADGPAEGDESPVDAEAFAEAWGAMTDTHQFFGLLRRFGVEREPAFRLVEGRYTRRVAASAMRDMLPGAAADGTPIMVFVGSPGCIQIHTGPVRRVEPMEMRGMAWLNVLDPGFSLHLREDRIAQAWVVEKPTDDGIVTSLELFDDAGGLMAMCFGARKPGERELPAWRALLKPLPAFAGSGQPQAT